MVQTVEQTHDEKVEMYKKCTKMELIGMLISSNLHIESVTKQLNKPVVMQVPQFEELLQVRLDELPYTKHLDDGQYNDGKAYGFECGARWAYETLCERLKLTCQCEVPTGRTVTADFENEICESCGRLVTCATAKDGLATLRKQMPTAANVPSVCVSKSG
jgi:hypothetical protein